MKNNEFKTTQENMRKIKCDLCSKDPALRNRVADYMQKKIWGITLKARCKKEIQEKENAILALQKLEGSIKQDSAKETINELRIQILDLENALAKQIEKEATFAYTEYDIELYSSYKSATTDAQIYSALAKWFANYGFDVSKNAVFIKMFQNAIAGERRASASVIIRSEGQQFTVSKRSKSDMLNIFYSKLSEFMLVKNVLSAETIPADIREYYAPKKKNK